MSFPRYPKYKPSGVEWLGDVPEHWSVLPCRAIVQERTAKNDDARCQDYLSLMANVGVIPYAEKGDIGNKKPEDLSKCKIVTRGDFVINSMNYGIGSYGLSDYDGVCSSVYIVLKPKNDVVESRFAFRIFECRSFQKFAQSFGNGILEHRSAINWGILKSIGAGIPPLEEQQSILEFLDRETLKIDGLVAEQRRLMELLKEKRQAVISHAVTKGLNPDAPMKPSGIEWLGDVPVHWAVVPVAYRYDVQLGKMLDSTKITGEHLRPYLRVFDVQWGEINTEELPQMDFDDSARSKFRLIPGDLLVNEGGSYPGRSAIWTGRLDECYYQKALHRLRPHRKNDDTTRFIYFVMFWAGRIQAASAIGGGAVKMSFGVA
jgi:type I restriction enzyme S subunit